MNISRPHPRAPERSATTDHRWARRGKAESGPAATGVREQSATVVERNRIDAAVRVREGGRSHRLPSAPAVARLARGDHSLACAAEDLHAPVGVSQDSWLDGADLAPRFERTELFPAGAQVGSALEMRAPPQMLGAGRTKQRAVAKYHRLVLDRTENAVRQTPGVTPSAPAIGGDAQHTPPAPWARPDLVEQQERAACRLMQHWVPARLRPAAPVGATRTSTGADHWASALCESQMRTCGWPS
jgi:hypothetical protein